MVIYIRNTRISIMSFDGKSQTDEEMYVTKRSGEQEIISFDKILTRIKKLGQEANIKLNYTTLVIKVIDQLYSGISTTKIDELSAEQCASMSSIHPDYNILAGRITNSNHHKNTEEKFSTVMRTLYNYRDKHNISSPLVTREFIDIVTENETEINDMCDYNRDYLIEYFGFKTLERAYLMQVDKVIVERPQHMWMRVAIGIHSSNMERVRETYDLMSQKKFTHATPTLFNAGTPHPQLSSCFLIAMENDSIDGIYNTLSDCARISKWAGGIGLHIHNVRASGSHIRGTNGNSNGIVPMLKVFNNTAKYVDQGGGKRNGSFAIYLEPWHADIENFLQMRKNHGDEEMKARDLFYALWIPDLFMQRVKDDGNWTLMCPDECPGLDDVHNEEFVALYEKYEAAGSGRKTMKARDLWFQALDAQMETGTPYLCYKDAANRKSNQQNLGTIKSSNLCVAPETLVLTDNGSVEIHTLKDKEVNVWNGIEFSPVTVYQTGIDQPLITVTTDDGGILRCTPYHRFFVYGDNNEYIDIRQATDLQVGDTLMECEYPIIKECIDEFTKVYDNARIVNNNNGNINMYADNSAELYKYKCLLQGCGINVPIVREQRGSKQSYLEICSKDMELLFKNGFSPIGFSHNEYVENSSIFGDIPEEPVHKRVKIVAITDFERIDNTFCFNEPTRNAGVFNGIFTSQCSEIMEYSNEEETAVCNLGSIALPTYLKNVDKEDGSTILSFDYDELHAVVKVVTYNLNRIIDVNFYPTEKTKRSNMRHRPIGIGVQGLADVFMRLDLPFSSDESKKINRNIFETIYHAALEQSCEMAEERYLLLEPLATFDDFSDRLSIDEQVTLQNHINSYEEPLLNTPFRGAYSSFAGSPASRGELQFDLWGVEPSDRYDWTELKMRIETHGMRNSLLVAPMPTASTSQILGYNECIEPITSNIYNRRTIAGEFILANKYLMHDLLKLDLWNEKMKNNIIANNGSIQHLEQIPVEIREKYRTVWEIPMRHLIDMAADRGAFVCQSQSLNLWLEDPNYSNLTSMHFYSWSKGLKTGIYYLRRRARHQAQQFTIEPEKKDLGGKMEEETEDEICEMCSA
jgi:ribonucleotide reductase alpha subunit